MNNARYFHTANLVLGDQVLVAGGFDFGAGTLATAEVYVPGPDVLSMVPDVVEVRPAAAAKLVQCAGLVASFRGAQPTNFTYVASQSPIAGQLVDRGSTVTMYLVTGGPSRNTRLPA
jgi:hypothetical protein